VIRVIDESRSSALLEALAKITVKVKKATMSSIKRLMNQIASFLAKGSPKIREIRALQDKLRINS